jgi:hypothetical protein
VTGALPTKWRTCVETEPSSSPPMPPSPRVPLSALIVRREAGEPSTGTKIFTGMSEGLWEFRCSDQDQTADLFEAVL